MSKPTTAKIWAECNALVDRDAKRSQLYDRLDALYFMANKKTSSDANVQYVTMPYATSVVDLVVDLAAQMEFSINVPAAGEGLDDERDAEGLENWLRAWLSMNGKKQQRNLIGEAAFLAAQRAQCIARTLFVDSAIKLPDTADGEATIAGLPVIFQLRDPRHVHVADGPLGPRCVVERWQRLAGDVRALYPNVLDPKLGDDDLIEWTEYWTATYRCYFANGEAVKVKGGPIIAHGYGCLPYAFGNARTTPFRDGEKRFRPILAAVEDLAAVIDTWYSINATSGLAAVTNAWAVYSDALSGENGKDLDLRPGKVTYLGSADKVQALQRAGMPPDFYQLGQSLLQVFQQSTIPFAVFGQSPGDSAGYAISLLSQAGRRVILPIWKAIEDMLAGAFLNVVQICRNKVSPLVGKQIPLVIVTKDSPTSRMVKRKLRLNVEKFGDDLDITVHLADPIPSDTAGALRMAIEATGAKLLSRETALEKWKLSSEPAAEADRIATEAIFTELAPIEGLKLAIKRGYAPATITLPPGFVAGPDGQLIPQALLDSIKGAQQAAVGGQGGPPPAAAPQGAAPGGMDMQALLQAMQAGMQPGPSGTGEPNGRSNPLGMNALSGAPIGETLTDVAGGEAPRVRMPNGF
jgi:hypothetical protein